VAKIAGNLARDRDTDARLTAAGRPCCASGSTKSHLGAVVVSLVELGARTRTLVVLGVRHVKPGVQFELRPTVLDYSSQEPARVRRPRQTVG
jgi:hypothetical protein